ncbi:MAG: hypothetical protein KF753_13685 [Caldilineaceae bacterium]|nr:hypothetical protein [Caldilineaceae bacterium]
MTQTETIDLARRWPSARSFVAIGSIAIIAAGIAAAATAGMPSYLASWAVAYLVLVVGVAQIALGLGQALLTPEMPSGRLVVGELVLFNLGSAAVLAGSLFSMPLFTAIGSALMLIVLAVLFWATRGSTRGGWLRYAYWLLIALLFVSVFIGLLIARGRAV